MNRAGRDGLRIVFADEYSFISQAHLSAISRRCQQVSGTHEALERSFGDYHVVLVGDPRQHTPTSGLALAHGAATETGLPAPDANDAPAVGGGDATGSGGAAVDGDAAEQRPPALAAARGLANNSDGRTTFRSLEDVINLTQQQRANDTPAGLQLRRYAELFMGETEPTLADVTEFCDAYNGKYYDTLPLVPSLLQHMPHVVTQRQTSRALIDLHLSLRIAAALGRRAVVWVSEHRGGSGGAAAHGPPVHEEVQHALLRYAVGRSADYLPPVFVFFEVRGRFVRCARGRSDVSRRACVL